MGHKITRLLRLKFLYSARKNFARCGEGKRKGKEEETERENVLLKWRWEIGKYQAI